jgi:hypothetical protein
VALSRDVIGWFIGAVIYLAILYTLVRPGSKGPTIVDSLMSTMADLVRGVVGYTYSNGTWTAPTGSGNGQTTIA